MAYKLLKPYTEEQRINFIVEYNHNMGMVIGETTTALCALEQWETIENDDVVSHKEEWDLEQFNEAKEAKYKENSLKGEEARENQLFTVTLGTEEEPVELAFDTSRGTQQDLQTAMTFLSAGAEKYDWIDNNGVLYSFTKVEELVQVSTIFMQKANIYPKWAYFKALIDEAKTIEEVNAITIDYGINLEE